MHSSDIISSKLDQFQMDTHERNRVNNLEFLYQDLIVRGYHHFMYGSAGSGKTTIMIHLAIEIAKKNKDLIVYFFYLDGTQQMASKMTEYIESIHLSHQIKILTTGTASDYHRVLESFLKDGIPLHNILFIYDTFKFLTTDVNVKNANKDAMHFIKNLTKHGATFVSLGHSNKDGVKQSGTAEIEQDSDALIRIDGIRDEEDNQLSTIKQAGRCRMDIKEVSFQFYPGDITSVRKLENPINVEKQLIKEKYEMEHREIINSIIELISLQMLKQSDILDRAKTHPILATIGQNKLGKILNLYIGKYWQVSIGDKNTHFYSLL